MSSSLYLIGRTISEGTFSTINIIKDKTTKKILVRKTVDNKEKGAINQEALLSLNASQWIIGFHTSFQDDLRTHLILEYLPGGTFEELLKRNGNIMDDVTGMFYLGELVLAINAVHGSGFAHRNLHPSNILLDALGHLKLSGFGNCSKIGPNGKVTSGITVDNPSYEAPEILLTIGNPTFSYGPKCDFWSLGVIAYEIMTGIHPFKSSSPLSAFKKITTGVKKGLIKFPGKVGKDCRDLISGLLTDENERLQYDDCIKHPFFNELIWDGLRNEIPPLKPIIGTEEVEEELLDEIITDENDIETNDVVAQQTQRGGAQKKNVTFIRPNLKDDGKNPEESRNWSISDMLDNNIPPQGNGYEEEKLKSELQIKTEQLMDKLHTIQILQTQLQKATETLDLKESQLNSTLKENDRLKSELKQVVGGLENEKLVNEMLEKKLENEKKKWKSVAVAKPQDTEDSSSSFELKEEIMNLHESVAHKEDLILELTIDKKILHHDLKIERMNNQALLNRDESKLKIFGYQKSIEEIRRKMKLNNSQNNKWVDLIRNKERELDNLERDIQESRVQLEQMLEISREKRSDFARRIGMMEVEVDKVMQECYEG